jgi:RND family efflux transporter MFP subunit
MENLELRMQTPCGRSFSILNSPFSILVLVSLAGLTGCGQQPKASVSPAPASVGAAAEAPVKVVKLERKTLRQSIVQPGHVEGFEQTPIYAKIPGYVRAVNADIDDKVEAGHPLIELSVPEMVEEAKQKAAAAVLAGVEVKQAREALKAAEARLDTAKAASERWESEYKRVEKLVREKVIDAQTGDETLNQYKAAAANLKENTAKRDVAKVDIEAAEAKQRVAEAEQRRVEALVGYTQIKAPYPSVVTQRNVHTGHFVQPPGGGKSDPLLIVERQDKYRVVVDVPEADAALIRKGDAVTIRVPALKGQSFTGKIQRTAWSLDAKARTLRAEMDWEKPDEKVRPGQYVSATITVERVDVWAVPESAVFSQDGQSFCYRVRDGKAVRTPVAAGIKDHSLVEISGPEDWQEGELIVATNPAGIQEGQAVKVAP